MSGMVCYMVLVWLLTLTLATDEQEEGCVNHPASKCPVVTKDQPCWCHRIEANTTVICCNIHNETVLAASLACAFQKEAPQGLLPPVTALQILNSTLYRLDMSSYYNFFQNLIGMSVTDSNITRISGRFPSSITCLNLSSNRLEEIDQAAFSLAPPLVYLDLSNNNLTVPPKLEFRNTKALFIIDLSGNMGLICKLLTELVVSQRNSSAQVHWANENNTYCHKTYDYKWFMSTATVPFSELDHIDQMEKECPKWDDLKIKCRCGISRNVQMHKGTHYYVNVDCSGLGLNQLPHVLPVYTNLLNVSNNNITQLDFLGTNPHYMNINAVDADNNRIQSITELEGSEFIDRFTYLSLRNNNIREIPKYMLSNVIDRNDYDMEMKLGLNKVSCDCSTYKLLKVWLLANQKHIKDHDELLCENFNNIPVVKLDQAQVCVYPRDWTDYIYYIIGIEILLLVLLVSKVSYDYWVFKTTGSLPWPASKMPRLPCDWVFEL